ncbi:uncharacterized protein G2W53_032930 [Senna tora]|uniref:Uncharacterized protein n=1 Tax=Senna tora TaxID=362788 RepID=A0A834WCB4_9FABA|nr:uncharacterized protein G2W53_032930 [Senna tora]
MTGSDGMTRVGEHRGPLMLLMQNANESKVSTGLMQNKD